MAVAAEKAITDRYRLAAEEEERAARRGQLEVMGGRLLVGLIRSAGGTEGEEDGRGRRERALQ